MTEQATATRKTKRKITNLELWKAYANDRSIENRNKLVEAYIPLADGYARHRSSGQEFISFEELQSAAYEGLIDAVQKFDAERGVAPETYLRTRMHGCIQDYWRDIDRRRRHFRLLEKAALRLMDRLGREPTADELSEESGHPVKATDEYLRLSIGRGGHCSLDDFIPNTDQNQRYRDRLGGVDPPRLNEDVQDAIKGCDRRERLLLICYYKLDMTMKQIGVELGISESRVSQMHTIVIERLRLQNGLLDTRPLKIQRCSDKRKRRAA